MELSLGLSKKLLRKLTERERFSDYLPYVAYDPESRIYHNMNSWGYIWECSPLWFMDEKKARGFERLFKLPFPEGSIMQFILYADPNIKPILQRFLSFKTCDDRILKGSLERYAEYLSCGTDGLDKLQGIPLRNFRLFVTLYFPEDTRVDNLKDVLSSIEDTLRGLGLCPSYLDVEDFVKTFFGLFNGRIPVHLRYDPTREIRRQLILSETRITNEFDRLEIGSRVIRIATPRCLPVESSILGTNLLTGDVWGISGDLNQIKCPFVITCSVIFEDLKGMIRRKAGIVLQQKAAGSFFSGIARRQEEFLWATDCMEKGVEFLRVIYTAVVFGKDEESARVNMSILKRIWEDNKYVMQEDRGIIPVLFISSLPFGLYNTGENIKMLDRDFIVPVPAIAELLPVQADFRGGNPQILFVGRKGEVVGIDFFDENVSKNMNTLVCASTGSGKSFLVNYIVHCCMAAGAYVRIIDVGRSYRKLCKVFGGNYIEFTSDSDISLNPFSHIVGGDKEDLEKNLYTIAHILLQMVYSYSNAEPSETEATIIKEAVRWVYENEGEEGSIDSVYRYLKDFRQYSEHENMVEIADRLAFNLREFTSWGAYGKWFSGRSTLDISKDRFVVLELEELKPKKELFKVVLLQVLNYVTYNLYLSDKTIPKLIIFDEAWQFFKEGGYLIDVIEEGDRRARKYKGSFMKVVQSILDLGQYKKIGDVLMNNSAYKFYLESGDFAKAKDEKLLYVDDFLLKLMQSVSRNAPKYSEVFVDSPTGRGIVRLVVSPHLYWLYTSSSGDNARLEELVSKGMDYLKAIGF